MLEIVNKILIRYIILLNKDINMSMPDLDIQFLKSY
jgi:hypothetical protein